jgi:CRP-like cAMP-binding protein
MDSTDLFGLLKQFSFTAGLPDCVLVQLADVGRIRQVPAGTLLFREGSDYGQLLIVAQGCVGLDMYVPGRGVVRILSLGPGDVVAWSVLLGSGTMTASALALENIKLVEFDTATLRAICERDHTVGYRLMQCLGRAVGDRLVATRLQLLDLFSDSPRAAT